MNYSDNLIVDLSFKFSLSIIDYTELLEKDRRYNISNQLFRSGTSIGANIKEAQGAESRSDLKHKIKIAYKEAEETKYWLLLCKEANNYPTPPEEIMFNIESLIKILGKIISSTITNS